MFRNADSLRHFDYRVAAIDHLAYSFVLELLRIPCSPIPHLTTFLPSPSETIRCLRFQGNSSRPTGYLWVNRYDPDDPASLLDHSCAPKTHGHHTDPAIVARILAARATDGWGAKKLLRVLQRHDPEVRWPARSTINDILNRHGLLKKRRRRRKWNHSGRMRMRSSALPPVHI